MIFITSCRNNYLFDILQNLKSHLKIIDELGKEVSFMTFDRGIFIFSGGNKRLRNVTKLYCQCQISHNAVKRNV
jgi:hypothetical protein